MIVLVSETKGRFLMRHKISVFLELCFYLNVFPQDGAIHGKEACKRIRETDEKFNDILNELCEGFSIEIGISKRIDERLLYKIIDRSRIIGHDEGIAGGAFVEEAGVDDSFHILRWRPSGVHSKVLWSGLDRKWLGS